MTAMGSAPGLHDEGKRENGNPLREADIRHLIKAFRESGCTSLSLSLGSCRLALHPRSARRDGGTGAEEEGAVLTAPSVGVFEPAPLSGGPVEAGTVLGSIRLVEGEVPVTASVTATVTARLAPAGAFVEYGQPLMTLRPEPDAAAGAKGRQGAVP